MYSVVIILIFLCPGQVFINLVGLPLRFSWGLTNTTRILWKPPKRCPPIQPVLPSPLTRTTIPMTPPMTSMKNGGTSHPVKIVKYENSYFKVIFKTISHETKLFRVTYDCLFFLTNLLC